LKLGARLESSLLDGFADGVFEALNQRDGFRLAVPAQAVLDAKRFAACVDAAGLALDGIHAPEHLARSPFYVHEQVARSRLVQHLR